MTDASPLGTNGNNFDDFEKLDPLASSGGSDDFNVSSSNIPSNPLDEDLYTATPAVSSQPLLDFSEPIKSSAEPAFQADSSAATSDPLPKSKSGGGSCDWFKSMDPRVIDLIYWRDVKKTGVVFGSMMFLLLSLAMFSLLSVIAYLALAGLTVTVSFRIYKNILSAVQKSGDGHPFKQYLEMDVAIPENKVNQIAAHIASHLSSNINELRRLFLVEDLVDSVKFGLLLWVLTYIGAWFNGMTLIILGVIATFTLPKVYESNKTQIDQYLDLARTQIKAVISQVKEKLPFPKKQKTQ